MGSPRSAQSPAYMLGAELYHARWFAADLHAWITIMTRYDENFACS